MSAGDPAALILAAGASSRLGRPKQLVPVEGEALLRRTARLALEAGCEPVVVVLGAGRASCAGALDGLGVLTVDNPGWHTGMASSLRVGMGALAAGEPSALLVLVCDQPRLSSASLARLLKHHRAAPERITAAFYAGRAAVPAVFPSRFFRELEGAEGDQGARSILARRAGEVNAVPMPEAAEDLDTPEDLAALEASASK